MPVSQISNVASVYDRHLAYVIDSAGRPLATVLVHGHSPHSNKDTPPELVFSHLPAWMKDPRWSWETERWTENAAEERTSGNRRWLILVLALALLVGLLAGRATAQMSGTPANAGALQGRPVSTTAPSDGQGLCFDAGTEQWGPGSCGGGGGGNVSNSGTPAAGQEAVWTNATHVKGQAKAVIDARNNGMLCDGSHDDTASLNAAIVAANTAGGGVVQLPFGVCNVTGVTIDGLTSVMLSGPIYTASGSATIGASKLKYTGTAGGDIVTMNRCHSCGLRNLVLDMNGLAQRALVIDKVGAGSNNQSDTDISHLATHCNASGGACRAGNIGIDISPQSSSNVENIDIHHGGCYTKNGGFCVHIGPSANAKQITISDMMWYSDGSGTGVKAQWGSWHFKNLYMASFVKNFDLTKWSNSSSIEKTLAEASAQFLTVSSGNNGYGTLTLEENNLDMSSAVAQNACVIDLGSSTAILKANHFDRLSTNALGQPIKPVCATGGKVTFEANTFGLPVGSSFELPQAVRQNMTNTAWCDRIGNKEVCGSGPSYVGSGGDKGLGYELDYSTYLGNFVPLVWVNQVQGNEETTPCLYGNVCLRNGLLELRGLAPPVIDSVTCTGNCSGNSALWRVVAKGSSGGLRTMPAQYNYTATVVGDTYDANNYITLHVIGYGPYFDVYRKISEHYYSVANNVTADGNGNIIINSGAMGGIDSYTPPTYDETGYMLAHGIWGSPLTTSVKAELNSGSRVLDLKYGSMFEIGVTGSDTSVTIGTVSPMLGDGLPMGFFAQPVTVLICNWTSVQQAFTLTWPANVYGGAASTPTLATSGANKCAQQQFIWENWSSKLRATGPMVSGAGTVSFSGTVTAPGFSGPLTGNADTAGVAAALSAQYIDWNASSGATSIANKPTLRYQTVDDEGSPLTQRSALNFAGSGVSCADDTDKTTCTISGGGTPSLDTVSDPAGNKAFTMGAYTLGFNWTTNSSTANLFTVSDFATNSGTGYLGTFSTGATSATKPFRACYRGTTDCITLDTTTFSTTGSTVFDATKLSGNLPAISGASLTGVDAATLQTHNAAYFQTALGFTPAALTANTFTSTQTISPSSDVVAISARVKASGTADLLNLFKNDGTTNAFSVSAAGTATAVAFSGPLTGDVTGNVTGTATALATARAINGVDFNGSAPITVPVNNANDTTNASYFPLFTATQGGNYAAKSLSTFTFNPSTGKLSFPAGGAITSADTGGPTVTFGTNKITFSKPIVRDGSLATGLLKNTISTGVESIGTGADVVALWASGSCSGYLKNDLTCDIPSGSITGTDTQVLFFDGANNPAGDAGMTYNKTSDVLSALGGFYGATNNVCALWGKKAAGTAFCLVKLNASDLIEVGDPTAAYEETFVTEAAPAAPSSGVKEWIDSTAGMRQGLDASGNRNSMVRTAASRTANQFCTHVTTAGVCSTAGVVAADISDATATPTASKIPIANGSGKLDSWISASSTTVPGLTEAATAAEVTSGTDAARAVTPGALAGSTIFGTKVVELEIFAPTTDTATGDGKAYFYVPAALNGMNLVSVHAQVVTAGTTNTTDVQIARCAAAASGNACSGTVVDMLSTKLTVDSGENSSTTAATPAVINTSNDDVATGQVLRVDVDAVSTTPAKGLIVTLELRLP